MSRQQLADEARISMSTLEKALSGRRPFTLATTIRLEEALGVALRKAEAESHRAGHHRDTVWRRMNSAPMRAARSNGSKGRICTLRPSFGEQGAIYAYRTDIVWDEAHSSPGASRRPSGSIRISRNTVQVAVPNQSGHVYLVTNRHGQYRLITVSRPTITGEMHGILTTLLAGRGSQLTPIAAPIAARAAARDQARRRVRTDRLRIRRVHDGVSGLSASARSKSRSRCFCRVPEERRRISPRSGVISRPADRVAVAVDLGAAIGAGPAAPHHLAERGRPAKESAAACAQVGHFGAWPTLALSRNRNAIQPRTAETCHPQYIDRTCRATRFRATTTARRPTTGRQQRPFRTGMNFACVTLH